MLFPLDKVQRRAGLSPQNTARVTHSSAGIGSALGFRIAPGRNPARDLPSLLRVHRGGRLVESPVPNDQGPLINRWTRAKHATLAQKPHSDRRLYFDMALRKSLFVFTFESLS